MGSDPIFQLGLEAHGCERGRLMKDTSSLPQISPKEPPSPRGHGGDSYLRRITPKLLNSVCGQESLPSRILPKPVLSEHPQRSDFSKELWGLCPPAFSASWPPKMLCASSHHQQPLPEPPVPSLTHTCPLESISHPCRQQPLWHQPPLSAWAHAVSWDLRSLGLESSGQRVGRQSQQED